MFEGRYHQPDLGPEVTRETRFDGSVVHIVEADTALGTPVRRVVSPLDLLPVCGCAIETRLRSGVRRREEEILLPSGWVEWNAAPEHFRDAHITRLAADYGYDWERLDLYKGYLLRFTRRNAGKDTQGVEIPAN